MSARIPSATRGSKLQETSQQWLPRNAAQFALLAPIGIEFTPRQHLSATAKKSGIVVYMKDSSTVSSPGPSDRSAEAPLDSWKEIATHVKRDVSTVQRWEKREGMPVHRHVHDKRGSVYAFSSELDAWLQSRKLRLEEEEKRTPRVSRWLVLGGVAVLALFAVTYVITRVLASKNATRPKITSLAVLP